MRSEGCSVHIRTDLFVRMIADAFPIKITVIAAKIENDIAGIRASYGVDETVEDLLSPFNGTSESRFVEHAYAELFFAKFYERCPGDGRASVRIDDALDERISECDYRCHFVPPFSDCHRTEAFIGIPSRLIRIEKKHFISRRAFLLGLSHYTTATHGTAPAKHGIIRATYGKT